MKSLANRLLRVTEGICKDYLSAYPADKKDILRDISRLTLLVKNRGLGVFTLDLPGLDSALTNGLKTGRLSFNGPLSCKVSKKVHVPRLFRGIWMRIFDVSGFLIEDPDPTAIAFLRQLSCIGKKVEVGCTYQRFEGTLDEYRRIESAIYRPTLAWESDHLGNQEEITQNHLCDGSTDSFRNRDHLFPEGNADDYERIGYLLRTCQLNFDMFAEAIGTFVPDSFIESIRDHAYGIGFRHGPGAVADLSKKEFKYDFPYWPAKLEARFPFEHFGCTQVATTRGEIRITNREFQQTVLPFVQEEQDPLPTMDDSSLSLPDNVEAYVMGSRSEYSDYFPESIRIRPGLHEPFSKLHAVPKTAKGPRLIASEPTSHQWCQQLTARFLVERTRGIFGNNFITINDQEPSRRFASKASLDGSLATVDLSSASDRLSCWLVERVFRRNPSILYALHSHRTRWLSYKGEYFLLRKFATQGTAVTFPVQSIVFLLIALTAAGFKARSPTDFIVGKGSIDRFCGKVRTFGDDIIIPKDGYDDLVLLLTTLGLKVNEEKSFSTGNFRESCGGDYFMGHDVTPIKTKNLSDSGPALRQSLIDYSNNLFQKGYWHAAKIVESMIPRWVYNSLPVIRHRAGGLGLTSFSGTKISHLKSRWNSELQRTEVLSYSSIAVVKKKKVDSNNAVLQYFSEAPLPTTKWEGGLALQPKTRDRQRWEFPHYA